MASGDEGTRELELGRVALAAFDIDAAVAHLSAAVRTLTAAGDPCRAALACTQLGNVFANAMGNLTAARAWFRRATRLIENEPPCVEQGWVAVAPMGCDVDDPDELLARAELALDRARQFGDVNLETKALADAGLAHVQAGRLELGMSLLDEAMALACGPADDVDVAGKSACSFFTACYFAADFGRASSWAAVMRDHGLIGNTAGAPIFLSNHCDSVQATLLCELGQWGDAEALLTNAISAFETAMPIPSWHPTLALADLRILQGRLTDAEALLLGTDDHIQAVLPTARLHLARGDHDLARATARRGLRLMANDRLRSTALLTVLVDAELAAGDVDAAVAASANLTSHAAEVDIPALRARARAAHARVLAATGDVDQAIRTLERECDDLATAHVPWLRATLFIELARLRAQRDDLPAATLDAKAASAILTNLDVVLPARELELLRRLGAGAPMNGATIRTEPHQDQTRIATLSRRGKWWEASYGPTRVRLPATKGLSYIAELVASAGSERHVLDLVDAVEGVAPMDTGIARRRIGDAGDFLDSQARSAYRHHIESLRSAVGDALAVGNDEAAHELQVEIDELVKELARAFGLGGRSRRASSAAERARLNVTRALRAATGKLADALPHAGPSLDRNIRTGLYCIYEPGRDDIGWIVQPQVNDGRPI